LPEPLRPVTTVKVLRGISTLMFFRLCWRAPRTVMLVRPMDECVVGVCSRCSAREEAQLYSRILVANIRQRQREVKWESVSVKDCHYERPGFGREESAFRWKRQEADPSPATAGS
jgi:hypothetical protein